MGEIANKLKLKGEVCRGCGGNGANSPIATYGSAYEICTGIKVSPSDGLPDKLCKNCVNKMIIAYNFRISCNCTDEHLSMIKQERLQEEPEINAKQLPSDSEYEEMTISEEVKFTPDCFDEVPLRNLILAPLDSADMSSTDKSSGSRTVNAGSSVSPTLDMLPTEENTDSEANQTTIDHSTRPKFRCNNCCKEYIKKHSFRRHQALYDCRQPYTCEICLRHFSHKQSLKAHHQKVHPGSTQQQQKTRQKSPRLIHNTEQKKCSICGAQIMQQMFFSHMLQHYRENPVSCKTCNAEFSSQGILYRHRQLSCPNKYQLTCPKSRNRKRC